jgi:hypothetical protein
LRGGGLAAERELRLETEQLTQLERVADGLRQFALPGGGARKGLWLAGEG